MWPFRSLLFTPAHKQDWVRKAIGCTPDGVILDLEDSVPPSEKPGARNFLAASLRLLADHGVGGFVRINPLDEGGREDVAAAVAPGLTCIILPKADNVGQIGELHDRISFHEGRAGLPHGSIAILPLPETAAGMLGAAALAGASARVKGLMGAVLGGEVGGDTAAAIGFFPSDDGLEQLFIASKIVLDSRAAGAAHPVAAINGIKINDAEAVRRLVSRARAIGYAGVAVIHPTHVTIANGVFAPTADDIAYSEGLLAAMAQAESEGRGAARYRGTMIDYAMVSRARQTVDEARRRRGPASAGTASRTEGAES